MVRVSFTIPESLRAEWQDYVKTLYDDNKKALARVIRQAMHKLIYDMEKSEADRLKEAIANEVTPIKDMITQMKTSLLETYSHMEEKSAASDTIATRIEALLKVSQKPLTRDDIFSIINESPKDMRKALATLQEGGKIQLNDVNQWELVA